MKFNMGFKDGTLNSDRAAIAPIMQQDHWNQKLMTRFMRGIFDKRSCKVKHTKT